MRYLIFTTPRTASQYVEHLLFPALQESYGYVGWLSEAFSPSRCLVDADGALCSVSLNEEKREKGSPVTWPPCLRINGLFPFLIELSGWKMTTQLDRPICFA